jgi:hypothetical protein
MGEEMRFRGWGVGTLIKHAACSILRASEMLTCGSPTSGPLRCRSLLGVRGAGMRGGGLSRW